MFSDELYVYIFSFLESNNYYTIINRLNFNKNTNYFLLQMFEIFFDKLNKIDDNSQYILKFHIENLLIFEYFNKHRHLEILNNYKQFNIYLKDSEWAVRLYNHNFTRVLNKNNEIIDYDESIKENVTKIMEYM